MRSQKYSKDKINKEETDKSNVKGAGGGREVSTVEGNKTEVMT